MQSTWIKHSFLITLLLISGSGNSESVSTQKKIEIVKDSSGKSYKIHQMLTPKTYEELQHILQTTKGTIAIAGGKFSQGGQIAGENVINMDAFQKIIGIDPKNKTITVQTGVTWYQIQKAIDPLDLSVKVMQSYADFTVGGALSVNVHGRYRNFGPVVETVRSIKIMLADGSIKTASRTENQDIFRSAIGGYGALGVILEATLDLAENIAMERQTAEIQIERYPSFFEKMIRNDETVILHNADLYPPDYKQAAVISWHETKKPVTIKEKLQPHNKYSYMGIGVNLMVRWSNLAKQLRKHYVDHKSFSNDMIVWRNYEASFSTKSLYPLYTPISSSYLQEYFIPISKFSEFTDKLRDILTRYNVNMLNISIRHIPKNDETIMSWSKEEAFSFVLFYYQYEWNKDAVPKWTKDLIDASAEVGGTFYLPYQILATEDQFHKAYPRSEEFFGLKRKYDPEYRFSNKLWDKYYKH